MYYNAGAARGPRGEYFPDKHEIFTPERACWLPRNGNVAEKSNHKITFEVLSAREGLVVVQILKIDSQVYFVTLRQFVHLASYPVDHLDIQGREKGPLLGSMWEELPHFEEAYAEEGGHQDGPCAEEEEVLLALACNLPWAAPLERPLQPLVGGLHQERLHSIEGQVLRASDCGTKIEHQPGRHGSELCRITSKYVF